MQHLVVDDVFQHVSRYGGMIKNAANDDRIVRRIVVSENAARLRLAPAHSWPGHQAVKEARIQVLEHGIEIIKMSTRRSQQLAAAHLPNQVRLAHDLVTANIFAVPSRLPAI